MQIISGHIVDVVNKKIIKGHLHFTNKIEKIIPDDSVIENNYIIPGFIDAHVHVESSMLIPSEFARLAVLHGTVATISDPHEIANVLGIDGVKFMIDNGKKTPFKFHFGAPSCVPATSFETAGAIIDAEGVKELLSWPDIYYLAEMMNFPGVYYDDPEVHQKLAYAKEAGKVIDGHLPGIVGDIAKKYIACGISTDHECFTLEEAEEKLAQGMKIIIREGSAAKNFEALWSLIGKYPGMIMFCSDDKHPNDLVRSHVNEIAKRAIAKGCDLFSVLEACSLNPIKHYNMKVGLLQEQDSADFCIVRDLKNFNVISTYIDGKLVAENNKSYISSVTEATPNNFSCNKVKPEDFKIENQIGKPVKVIVVEDGQLITKEEHIDLQQSGNEIHSDINQDVLKIAVINRYQNQKPAIALIKNTGLKNVAIASCVAHDSHNIIVVGTNDEDIANATNLIIQEKGGVSLANGQEKLIVPLPVAGIMSNKDAYEVADLYEAIDARAKELGSTLKAPYMTLSFCALLVIPKLKLSDKGLFDGEKFEFTPLFC